jgi:hypothetical protein
LNGVFIERVVLSGINQVDPVLAVVRDVVITHDGLVGHVEQNTVRIIPYLVRGNSVVDANDVETMTGSERYLIVARALSPW